jgi:microcystin-dependent protein
MGQHGFGSFAASARSGGDLSSILQALQSGHIGEARPSYVEDGMVWHKYRPAEGAAGTVEKWFSFGGVDHLEGVFDLATGVYSGAFSGLPPGSVHYVAGSAAPVGYLKANGAWVSRSVYADLFAAISTTYGVGNGSSHFTLPDLRGEFIRGWNDSPYGADGGRLLGSFQPDEFKEHRHTLRGNVGGGVAILFGQSNAIAGIGSGNAGGFQDTPNTMGDGGGGVETRPRNVALLAVIKF